MSELYVRQLGGVVRITRQLILLFIFSLSAVRAGAQVPVDTSAATSIDWAGSYDQAKRLADTTKRQILLDLYTDWCRWCRVMDESTFTDPGVIALQKRLVFVRIDAEADTAMARRYAVWGYPTVVLTNTEGLEVDRVVGYLPPPRFQKTIVDYLEGRGVLWDLERRAREKPSDMALVFAMGESNMRRGEFDKARTQFEQVVARDAKNESGRVDDAAFALAMMQRRQESWYKAIEGFKQVVKKYPKSEWCEDAAIYIPWLYAQAGDTTDALKFYNGFLKDFKNSTEVDWVQERIRELEKPEDQLEK